MKPEWRTETVVQLCQAMRETGEYHVLPILADALQDAGCDDEKMLEAMRGRLGTVDAQRLVALAYSNETEQAVRRVESFAAYLSPRAFCEEGDGYGEETDVTYERIMAVGDRWTEPNDEKTWRWNGTVEHGSDDLRDSFRAEDFDEFWDAYEKITGRIGERGNPFGCTC